MWHLDSHMHCLPLSRRNKIECNISDKRFICKKPPSHIAGGFLLPPSLIPPEQRVRCGSGYHEPIAPIPPGFHDTPGESRHPSIQRRCMPWYQAAETPGSGGTSTTAGEPVRYPCQLHADPNGHHVLLRTGRTQLFGRTGRCGVRWAGHAGRNNFSFNP